MWEIVKNKKGERNKWMLSLKQNEKMRKVKEKIGIFTILKIV